MVRKIMLSLCVLCFGLLVFTTSASADRICPKVAVVGTGTTIDAGDGESGIYVTLRNDSENKCGALTSGSESNYYLNSADQLDRTYVTVITAMSFNRYMKVTIAGTAKANSIIISAGITDTYIPTSM